jgi:hypothetical protein
VVKPADGLTPPTQLAETIRRDTRGRPQAQTPGAIKQQSSRAVKRCTHSASSATSLQPVQADACPICHICHIGPATTTSVTTVINLSSMSAWCHVCCRATPSRRLSNLSNRLPDAYADPPFTVIFYGLTIFSCKTAQRSVTQRECRMAELPSVSVAAQRSENARKNSFLNYESPALTAELQARVHR